MADKWGYASPSKMLREMTGFELHQWQVEFSIREQERRDQELDAKGKARIRRLRR